MRQNTVFCMTCMTVAYRGVLGGGRTPPLTWQNFCWCFNHTEWVKTVISTKILNIFWKGAQPLPQNPLTTHPTTSAFTAPRPSPCWNLGYATGYLDDTDAVYVDELHCGSKMHQLWNPRGL